MSLLPVVLGVAAAIVALSLVASVLDAVRGRGVRTVPPWAFALLPVAGFAFQEYIERWLAWGFMPWYAAAQPTFLVGIALQLPFGALAYLAARFLLRSAKRLGSRLARRAPPRLDQLHPACSSRWHRRSPRCPRFCRAVSVGAGLRSFSAPDPFPSPPAADFVLWKEKTSPPGPLGSAHVCGSGGAGRRGCCVRARPTEPGHLALGQAAAVQPRHPDREDERLNDEDRALPADGILDRLVRPEPGWKQSSAFHRLG